MTPKTKTRLLGGGIALLGIAAILLAREIETGAAGWGARMVPTLSGLVMISAGIAVTFERTSVVDAREADTGRDLNALWLVLFTAAYVTAIGLIGYLAATCLAAPVLLVMFGTISPIKLLGAAILCPAALHIFFFELLGIFPPRAAWFDLADILGL